MENLIKNKTPWNEVIPVNNVSVGRSHGFALLLFVLSDCADKFIYFSQRKN